MPKPSLETQYEMLALEMSKWRTSGLIDRCVDVDKNGNVTKEVVDEDTDRVFARYTLTPQNKLVRVMIPTLRLH